MCQTRAVSRRYAVGLSGSVPCEIYAFDMRWSDYEKVEDNPMRKDWTGEGWSSTD